MNLFSLLETCFFFLCIIWLGVTFAFFKSSGQTQPFLRNTLASTFEILPTTAASKPVEKIISRDTSIKVTSDVRGNLGPASVIIQNPPGKNWINDRWQAASNMHGLSIPGQHWVVLDFIINTSRHITKVVIDWEAAYSNNYRVEVSEDNSNWCVLFDGNGKGQESMKDVKEYGQSPGVKNKTPLHIVHTISLNEQQQQKQCASFRYLRVFIKNSPTGWGVSIWELDIYGWYE